MEGLNSKSESTGSGAKYKGLVMIAAFPEGNHVLDNLLDNEKERIENLFHNLGYKIFNWSFSLAKVGRKAFLEELVEATTMEECYEKFVMIVMCPQRSGRLRMTSESTLEVQELYRTFTAKNCPNMISKLKLFIFHTHPYVKKSDKEHHCNGSTDKKDKQGAPKLTIPNEADLLVVYSCEDEDRYQHSSFNVSDSTWKSFIDIVHEVLQENYEKEYNKDILELMVDVINKTHEKNDPNKPVPMIVSTLLKEHYLR